MRRSEVEHGSALLVIHSHVETENRIVPAICELMRGDGPGDNRPDLQKLTWRNGALLEEARTRRKRGRLEKASAAEASFCPFASNTVEQAWLSSKEGGFP